jgi:hypothetical protein
MELANILNRPLTPPNTPPPPSTPPPRTSHTTRDQRLQAQTLRDISFTYAQICKQLDLTFDQIQYAVNHHITPQKCKGRPLKLAPKEVDQIIM